ncbi:CCG-binding protein 1 [Vitis riparia]|uniref:CCG-binding protein 1 n=1 Tax=Vitis vinifera TaxID=29760 RepID=A0A438EPM1_VITVI|nr:CCG-binding protein 1 [Vitis riparia]RVW49689.1 CCG-binding protein 1 [Vitis vinifera]
MIKSFALSSPSLIFDVRDSRSSTVCCSSRNSQPYIPKLEPFSRSKLDRVLKEPPLIQKCENELMDYCSTLEGDDSYSCWQAYFELKDLEKESPKEDVEKLILQVGGLKSLIGCLHHVATFSKGKKAGIGSVKAVNTEKEEGERPFPVPDGLPKSQEELEEEDKGRMPDSAFTRLLRTKGRFPAWYSPAPDHETD